jgi:plastocyanin
MRGVAAAAAAVLALAAPAVADAGDATGTITGTITVDRADGAAAVPVVVYVVGFTEPAPEAAVEVQQHDKKFVPDLVVITAGQTVSFPNGDPFLHNVFSPTESRKFDLGSYKQGDTRTRKFPHPGVSDVFCNIHPEMSATILVLPNKKFAFAAADGSFSIADVPVGSWTVFAYSRHATAPVSAEVEVAAGAAASVALTLDETARDFTHKNKYGEKYRGDGEYRPTK